MIWSTTPLAIKWSTEGQGPLFGVAARMALGTFLCLVILATLRMALPLHRDALITYAISGAGLYFAMTFVYIGAQYIPSGLISVVFGLSPIITSMLASFWLEERSITLPKIGGLLLALGGLAFVFHDNFQFGNEAAYGIALILIATIVHAISAVWIKKVDAHLSAMAITTGSMIAALPFYLVTWFSVEGTWPSTLSAHTFWAIAYLAVFGSVFGFVMYYYTLKRVRVTTLALITLITPVLALFIGQQFNNEMVSWTVWAGTALILFGITCHQWETGFTTNRKQCERNP